MFFCQYFTIKFFLLRCISLILWKYDLNWKLWLFSIVIWSKHDIYREWNREFKRTKNTHANQGKDEVTLEKKIRKPSLLRALFRVFIWENMLVGFIILLQSIMRAAWPSFQGKIIDYFSINSPKSEALTYGILMIIFVFVTTIMWHHFYLTSQQVGIRLRTACTTLIYRKVFTVIKKIHSRM